jgi:hypothetical protein
MKRIHTLDNESKIGWDSIGWGQAEKLVVARGALSNQGLKITSGESNTIVKEESADAQREQRRSSERGCQRVSDFRL